MQPNNLAGMPAAERVMAPVPSQPRQMQVERQGDATSAYSRRFPTVRGGICEYCGVIDGEQPSEYQYKMCEHYRGMQLRCSYCPQSKNPDDVINHAILHVQEHPEVPGKLIVWCDSYNCSKAHTERFRIATA